MHDVSVGADRNPTSLHRYMDDSKIIERGTHNELMTKKGKYAELWNLQAQAFL